MGLPFLSLLDTVIRVDSTSADLTSSYTWMSMVSVRSCLQSHHYAHVLADNLGFREDMSLDRRETLAGDPAVPANSIASVKSI